MRGTCDFYTLAQCAYNFELRIVLSEIIEAGAYRIPRAFDFCALNTALPDDISEKLAGKRAKLAARIGEKTADPLYFRLCG